MLKYTKGDLLELAITDFDVIVHGCNCQCMMGGGIAKQIARKYLTAEVVDFKTRAGDYKKLGTWTEVDVGPFIIINAYTQFRTSCSEDVFEYTAFKLILQKLLHEYGNKKIGFPYIGMGLAGGDSSIIIPMIESFAIDVAKKGGSVTLVEFGS
jgi:O-acetyl-ADP-ribose deacetylase (regulator of RNase III)